MAETGPLVVACLAPADQRPSVDPLTGAVGFDERRAELSASDAAALEYALRAAEAWGGRAVALGAGPEWIEPALHQAVALGAQAVRVPLAGAGEGRPSGAGLAGAPEQTAAALASAIADLGGAALVVCGDRSPTHGVGAVPALLAHALGATQALGLVSLSIEEVSVIGERRLDGGWRERVRVCPPAVCSVEAAGVQLRRATLRAVLDAESVAVTVAARPPVVAVGAGGTVAAGGAGPRSVGTTVRIGPPRPYRPRTHAIPAPAGDTRQRLLALTGALVDRDPPRVVGPLSAGLAADELLDYLERHGYQRTEARPAVGPVNE